MSGYFQVLVKLAGYEEFLTVTHFEKGGNLRKKHTIGQREHLNNRILKLNCSHFSEHRDKDGDTKEFN